MKIVLSALVTASIAVIACNNNSQPTTTNSDTTTRDTLTRDAPPAQDSVLSGCYAFTGNRDTASLQMQVKSNIVTGSLSYNLYEKDHNDGTFEGELVNDIITGWYLFRSEGKMSVRQVAWKVKPGHLWPATGETIVRNDTAMYKNPASLRFDSTRAFVKVKCLI